MSLIETFSATMAGAPPVLVIGVFLLAGIVKGVVGLGLPTISIALLALMMAPVQAVALLIIPSLITNVWQIRPWTTAWPMVRRLAPMQVGVFTGTLGGAWWLGAPAGAWAMVSLGAALIAYALWSLSGKGFTVPVASQRWLGPMVGLITGFVTSATGVFAIPAVPYLQGLGLQRDELIQAMGISFTVSTLALAMGLYVNSSYPVATLGVSTLMLLPAIAGMQLGEYLRDRLSPLVFKRVFLSCLALLGVHMIAREWLFN
ncbi:sulfite exporter TauE/SafE family protein [Hydrogenophaga sp.]|jgi:uncharacterized membrane protein YfcA|uniref:sulfite exporter TauE/SafE family protein n=1 Tax=Hydrogenophaga sp. TaxID=1904254 RepID=UPI003F712E4B